MVEKRTLDQQIRDQMRDNYDQQDSSDDKTPPIRTMPTNNNPSPPPVDTANGRSMVQDPVMEAISSRLECITELKAGADNVDQQSQTVQEENNRRNLIAEQMQAIAASTHPFPDLQSSERDNQEPVQLGNQQSTEGIIKMKPVYSIIYNQPLSFQSQQEQARDAIQQAKLAILKQQQEQQQLKELQKQQKLNQQPKQPNKDIIPNQIEQQKKPDAVMAPQNVVIKIDDNNAAQPQPQSQKLDSQKIQQQQPEINQQSAQDAQKNHIPASRVVDNPTTVILPLKEEGTTLAGGLLCGDARDEYKEATITGFIGLCAFWFVVYELSTSGTKNYSGSFFGFLFLVYFLEAFLFNKVHKLFHDERMMDYEQFEYYRNIIETSNPVVQHKYQINKKADGSKFMNKLMCRQQFIKIETNVIQLLYENSEDRTCFQAVEKLKARKKVFRFKYTLQCICKFNDDQKNWQDKIEKHKPEPAKKQQGYLEPDTTMIERLPTPNLMTYTVKPQNGLRWSYTLYVIFSVLGLSFFYREAYLCKSYSVELKVKKVLGKTKQILENAPEAVVLIE